MLSRTKKSQLDSWLSSVAGLESGEFFAANCHKAQNAQAEQGQSTRFRYEGYVIQHDADVVAAVVVKRQVICCLRGNGDAANDGLPWIIGGQNEGFCKEAIQGNHHGIAGAISLVAGNIEAQGIGARIECECNALKRAGSACGPVEVYTLARAAGAGEAPGVRRGNQVDGTMCDSPVRKPCVVGLPDAGGQF